MAAAVIASIPCVLLFFAAQRFFVRGIVMTGGGALIRGLDVLLQQETGLPIHLDEDPMTCVVRGTGRILDDPEKYRNVLTT